MAPVEIELMRPEHFREAARRLVKSEAPLRIDTKGEHIYICPACGRPKLYYNPHKQKGICFRCEEGFGLRRNPPVLKRPTRGRRRAPVDPQKLWDRCWPLHGTEGDTARVAKRLVKRRQIAWKNLDAIRLGTGLMNGRVCFPMLDGQGTVTGVQGRRLFKDGGPKYRTEGSGLVVPQRSTGYATAAKGVTMLLVEGPLDAFRLWAWWVTKPIKNLLIGAVCGHQVGPFLNWAAVQPRFIRKVLLGFELDVESKTAVEARRIPSVLGHDVAVKQVTPPADWDELQNEEIEDLLV